MVVLPQSDAVAELGWMVCGDDGATSREERLQILIFQVFSKKHKLLPKSAVKMSSATQAHKRPSPSLAGVSACENEAAAWKQQQDCAKKD